MDKELHDIKSDLSSLRTASEVLSGIYFKDKKISLQMIQLMQEKLQKIKQLIENSAKEN